MNVTLMFVNVVVILPVRDLGIVRSVNVRVRSVIFAEVIKKVRGVVRIVRCVHVEVGQVRLPL